MSTCKFKTSEVKRCVEHSLNSQHWLPGHKHKKPCIAFAHDEGVYLMSAGIPPDVMKNKTYVTYAEGCDPNKDEDHWDQARDLVGGDDFAEYLNITARTLKMCDKYEELHVIITKTKLQGVFVKPKQLQAQEEA